MVNSDFVVSRKQLRRLVKIVSILKRGPRDSEQLLRELEKSAQYDSADTTCSGRTLRHDIKILKDEYSCPIRYARGSNQYILTDLEWYFMVPSVLDRKALLALVIGGKFSQDILPVQLAQGVTNAVDEVLRSSETTDFPSRNRLSALKILTRVGEPVSEKIFLMVFDAWRGCHRLLINYKSSRGEMSSRVIEPHALVFFDLQWNIRAFCPQTNEWRTFLVSRIDSAYSQETVFTPNDKVIGEISSDNFFRFENAGPVRIQLTREGVRYAEAHPLRSTQQILSGDEEGVFTLYVSDVSEEEMLRWVFAQLPGDAIPLAPSRMVEVFRRTLQKMLSMCPEKD